MRGWATLREEKIFTRGGGKGWGRSTGAGEEFRVRFVRNAYGRDDRTVFDLFTCFSTSGIIIVK